MVVLSTFNSWVRPVMPALRRTSLAIIYVAGWIMAADGFKSNANVKTDASFARGDGAKLVFAQFPSRVPNHLPVLGKQWRRIVRARRGLRMVLHAKNRLGLVSHPLYRLIVEVDAIHLHICRQRFRVHRKPVVLGRDLHPARAEILHRLVGTAMAEL